MKKLFTVLTLLTFPLFAEDYKNQLYITSLHIGKETPAELHLKDWNRNNIGYSHKFDNNIRVGGYYNSQYEITAFAGYEYSFNDYFGAMVAVGTGYEFPIGVSLYGQYKNIRIDVMPFIEEMKKVENGVVKNEYEQSFGVAFGFSLVF